MGTRPLGAHSSNSTNTYIAGSASPRGNSRTFRTSAGVVRCGSSGIPQFAFGFSDFLRTVPDISNTPTGVSEHRPTVPAPTYPHLHIRAIQKRVDIPLTRRDVALAAGHGASGFHHRHVSLARQDRHFPSKLEIGDIWHFLSLKLYTHPSQGVSMILDFTASPPAAEGIQVHVLCMSPVLAGKP